MSQGTGVDHVEEGEKAGLSQCISPYVLFVNHINNSTSQNVSAVGFTIPDVQSRKGHGGPFHDKQESAHVTCM